MGDGLAKVRRPKGTTEFPFEALDIRCQFEGRAGRLWKETTFAFSATQAYGQDSLPERLFGVLGDSPPRKNAKSRGGISTTIPALISTNRVCSRGGSATLIWAMGKKKKKKKKKTKTKKKNKKKKENEKKKKKRASSAWATKVQSGS